MRGDLISVVAKVQCRSEGRVDQTPVAVVIGGERFSVVDVIDRATVAGVVSGEPVRRRFWVELEDGRRCQLTRAVPDGEWRVEVQVANVKRSNV